MKALTLLRCEHIMRLVITSFLPQKTVVKLYSQGRKKFLKILEKEIVSLPYYKPSTLLERHLWGLTFRTPLINAAGMFKNGECYRLMYKQGAGGYLGGTTTAHARMGNTKDGIHLPFVTYPRSGAASNYLGLPNEGNEINVLRAGEFPKLERFPLGWSFMASPDDHNEKTKLENLVKGMQRFEDAGIDFLEINESCPNTDHSKEFEGLEKRLRYVKTNYLDQRSKLLPVIVKLSTDTKKEDIPQIMDLLFSLKYDGVNFGNTSVEYQELRNKIHQKEHALFDYFTRTFGGGVSGKPLKEKSLDLCRRAVNYLGNASPSQEFHIIRTGGIESFEDIKHSEQVGVSLNQWLTGYWKGFTLHRRDVYRDFFE